jgi:hypothetical protein
MAHCGIIRRLGQRLVGTTRTIRPTLSVSRCALLPHRSRTPMGLPMLVSFDDFCHTTRVGHSDFDAIAGASTRRLSCKTAHCLQERRRDAGRLQQRQLNDAAHPARRRGMSHPCPWFRFPQSIYNRWKPEPGTTSKSVIRAPSKSLLLLNRSPRVLPASLCLVVIHARHSDSRWAAPFASPDRARTFLYSLGRFLRRAPGAR